MSIVRTFVSIPVPDTPAMAELRSQLSSAGVRATPPEQTHITLCFIGDVDESKVKRITECVKRAASGFSPFEMTLSGVGAFPNERRPSVVWIGVTPANVVKALAAKIEKNLTDAGVAHDTKPFKAHVTIARCRDGFMPGGLFEENRRTGFCRFECTEVLVMKSVLAPSGAKHTVLSRVPLTGSTKRRLPCHTDCSSAPL